MTFTCFCECWSKRFVGSQVFFHLTKKKGNPSSTCGNVCAGLEHPNILPHVYKLFNMFPVLNDAKGLPAGKHVHAKTSCAPPGFKYNRWSNWHAKRHLCSNKIVACTRPLRIKCCTLSNPVCSFQIQCCNHSLEETYFCNVHQSSFGEFLNFLFFFFLPFLGPLADDISVIKCIQIIYLTKSRTNAF